MAVTFTFTFVGTSTGGSATRQVAIDPNAAGFAVLHERLCRAADWVDDCWGRNVLIDWGTAKSQSVHPFRDATFPALVRQLIDEIDARPELDDAAQDELTALCELAGCKK